MERNVSAAANKAFISQPAMSASLKQLRALFDDPLLIKTKGKSVLSTKAATMQPKLEVLMNDIQNLLKEDTDFDPQTAKRTFKIALPDYVELILLPLLLKALEHYPHIILDVRIAGLIEDPSIFLNNFTDIAIGAVNDSTSSSALIAKKLYDEKIICFASKNNPALRKPISLKQYLTKKHIAFSFDTHQFSHSADVLHKKKLKRNDILFVNNILPAIFAVSESNSVISTAPSFLITRFAEQLGLVQQPLPFELEPTPIFLVTHKKNYSDKGIQWLLQLITENMEQLEAEIRTSNTTKNY